MRIFGFLFLVACGRTNSADLAVHVEALRPKLEAAGLLGATGILADFEVASLPGNLVGETRCYKTDVCTIVIDPHLGDCALDHVLVHEIGHALGLQHVPDKGNIMFATCDSAAISTNTAITQLTESCGSSSCRKLGDMAER